MNVSILFGEIFRFQEREFIFLADGVDVIYAIRILNDFDSQRIINQDNSRAKRTDGGKYDHFPIYCYVILSTQEYKDRAAHLGIDNAHDPNSIQYDKTGITITNEDKLVIRTEILDPNSPVPKGLKEIVRQLDIK